MSRRFLAWLESEPHRAHPGHDSRCLVCDRPVADRAVHPRWWRRRAAHLAWFRARPSLPPPVAPETPWADDWRFR